MVTCFKNLEIMKCNRIQKTVNVIKIITKNTMKNWLPSLH